MSIGLTNNAAAHAHQWTYDEASEGYELRHYIRVLSRRKFSVILPIIVFTVAAFLLTNDDKPTFQSRAEVLLQPVSPAGAVAASAADARAARSSNAVSTEIAILNSAGIRAAVEQALGRQVDVTALPLNEDADVAVVRARASTRALAQEDARTYAQTYVNVRRSQLAGTTTDVTNQLQAEVSSIDAQITALEPMITDLDAQIIAAYDPVVRNGLENRREELLAQRQSLQLRRSTQQQQLDRLELIGTSNPTFGIGLLSDASVPERQKGAQRRTVAAAGGLGLVIGLLLALAREHFDNSVKTKRDLEAATGGAPVLALLPTLRRRMRTGIVTRTMAHSPAAESYRKLRTALQLARQRTVARSVLITSPTPGDDKTLTAANLAVALSSLGGRVLLIDANLHRPKLHTLFSLRNDVGFTSALSGSVSLEAATQSVAAVPNLAVMTAGPTVADPAAQLSSNVARQCLLLAESSYDVVLLDGPPLLPVSDGLVLAELVDGVLLVARARHTDADDVSAAVELLAQSGTPLLGAVLSEVDRKAAHLATYDAGTRRGRKPAQPEARDAAAIALEPTMVRGRSTG
jgi:capsular exopolysaccharide synthesis family protein